MNLRSCISCVLVSFFALKRPRDWVLKPLFFLVLVNGMTIYFEHVMMGSVIQLRPDSILVHSAVALPFIIIMCGIVTYLFRVQNQLTHIAMTDVLTGLPNRRAFLDNTKRAFVAGHTGFLLILDADHFKRINDTHGHAVGDACLVAIADRLRAVLEPSDVLGRIGGEEFAVYLDKTDKARLIQVGKKLTCAIIVPIEDGPQKIRLTMSIGATATDPLEPVETAIQRADVALYHAKNNGRARMIVGPRAKTPQAA